MNESPALECFLRTDPRHVGCAKAMELCWQILLGRARGGDLWVGEHRGRHDGKAARRGCPGCSRL
jgi:hypothetical protein